MVPWNAARTKVQIKLSIQRLRTLQEKKLALAKASRRDIADLLQKNRVETARLRVEGLIQDDIYVELLEVLELYLETLQARFGLLDMSTGETPEASIADAVCAVVYAAPRVELKEMHMLREMLMHKYGRNFSLALQPSDPPPPTVPKRVLSKLALFIPSKELVDAYLGEIAKGYGVAWLPEPSFSVDQEDSGQAGSDGEGGEVDGGEANTDAGAGKGGVAKKATGEKTEDESSKGPKEDGRNAESESMPEATTANIPPPPAGPEKDAWAAPGKKMTEEEELAKRFERLKQLK